MEHNLLSAILCFSALSFISSAWLVIMKIINVENDITKKSNNYKYYNLEMLDKNTGKKEYWFKDYTLETLTEHEHRINQEKIERSYIETRIIRIENQLEDLEKNKTKRKTK